MKEKINMGMHTKTFKMLLTLLLVVSLTGNSFVGKTIGGDHLVYAAEYRNGYKLQPTVMDATGVGVDSTFILSSKVESLSMASVYEKLQVPDGMTFTVEEKNEAFEITMNEPLERSRIYTFEYEAAKWTFQTMKKFELLGILPAHESSNVPINTGIEMYFSHAGVQVDDYFEISPKAEGKFEIHGKVAVFVPEALKKGKVYKVTVKKGLPLKGSEQVLEEDYTFSFETEMEESESDYRGYFAFRQSLMDITSQEKARIPMHIKSYRDQKDVDDIIDVVIYQYRNDKQFETALLEKMNQPMWARSGTMSSSATSGLKKVTDFTQKFDPKDYRQETLDVPITLDSGYYIIKANWNELETEILIQVADFSYTVMKSNDQLIYWLTDMESKAPGEKGKIYAGEEVVGSTDKDGLAIVDVEKALINDNALNINRISYNTQSMYYVDYTYDYVESNRHWQYFQTDRELYKPDDEIQFFGFIKNRYNNESTDELTIELSSRSWWWFYDRMPFANDDVPLEKTTVKVIDGFYDGSLEIPNLEPDSYQLTVKLGDEIINQRYISVENYVKPDYKLELTKDKNAIFVGEPIEFKVKTLFYEGTPVSNIPVTIDIGGLEYKSMEVVTDAKGEYTFVYTPEGTTKDTRYKTYGYVNVRAKLPESGEIYSEESFSIFTRDVYLDVDTDLVDGVGTIDLEVNKIDLEPLNTEESKEEYDQYNDDYKPEFVGEGIPNQKVDVVIYKNVWHKTEVGTIYDFINKVTRKQYDYDLETTEYKRMTVTTDELGKGNATVDLPYIEDGYYNMVAKTTDLQNRGVEVKSSFYPRSTDVYKESYSNFHPDDEDYYRLMLNKEQYDMGDRVNIQLINENGNKMRLQGYFLYVIASENDMEVQVLNDAAYETTFKEDWMPNVYVDCVWFDGEKLVQVNDERIRFDYSKNEMIIKASLDQEAYKPGESCTINIEATYYDEATDRYMPVKDAVINISAIDEALLSLNDMSIRPLKDLYRNVANKTYSTYTSHNMMNSMPYLYRGMAMGGMVKAEACKSDNTMAEVSYDMAINEEAGGGASVRSEFKDTGVFSQVRLNEEGIGSYTFTLPDNITSWRVMLAGVSNSLKAGSQIENLKVSLPYFINANLNETYLVGDQPYIGISSYGTGLAEGEAITYKVYCDAIGLEKEVIGKAFERLNVALPELAKGTYKIIVEGYSKSGFSDGLETVVQVVDSYHQIETADYYEAVEGLTFKADTNGMTKVVFVDQGKGRFINDLYALVYYGGKRIDQKYVSYLAKAILEESFGLEVYKNEEVSIFDYMKEEGLISILPYSEGNVETTINMLPLLIGNVETSKIKMALEAKLYDINSEDQAKVLYGLSVLGEEVLIELNDFAAIETLTLEDQIYVALSYANLGDTYSAETIYENVISQYVKEYDEISVVEYGDTKDDYLYYTSLVALLSAKIDLGNRYKLFDYMSRYMYSKEVLINPLMLTFIQDEIDTLVSSENAKVSYEYNNDSYEKELKNGWAQSVTLPSAKLDTLKINKVVGDIAVVTVALKPIKENIELEQNLSVTKKIYSLNSESDTLEEGDIVKVVIDYDIDDQAIDNYYTITDYAPSGIRPLSRNQYHFNKIKDRYYTYSDVDGQKVSFYAYKNNTNKSLSYYARVTSIGEFKAEGTLIQGVYVKDSINIGEEMIVKIK